MSQSKGRGTKELERLSLTNKPTLIISYKLKQQIDYLHKKVGSYEWSGELITSEKGSIRDLEDFEITAEDIWLADIGTAGFTGYEVDKGGFKAVDIVDMYEAFPGLLDGSLKNHHIHTHHNMGAFFSGTDEENLEERASQSNYFMMLVVDFKGEYKAKLAFKAEVKNAGATQLHFLNNSDGFEPLEMNKEKEREVLVVMECKILHEAAPSLLTEQFLDRYDSVEKAIEDEKKSKVYTYTPGIYGGSGGTNSYIGTRNRYWDPIKKEWKPLHRPAETKEDSKQGTFFGKTKELDEEDFDTYIPVSKRGKGKTKKTKSLRSRGKNATRKPGKTKKIFEMSDEEYKEFQRIDKIQKDGFELRHATALINSIIDKEPGLNFTPVFNRLYNVGWEIKKTYEDNYKEPQDKWIAGFILSIPDYVELLWPETSENEDILDMENTIVTLLTPYRHHPFVNRLVELVSEDIAEMWDDLVEEDAEMAEEEEKELLAEAKAFSKEREEKMDQDEQNALMEATITSSLDKDDIPMVSSHTSVDDYFKDDWEVGGTYY